MRRRDFVAGLCSAAAIPAVGRAQPSPIPVVGILHSGSREASRADFSAFQEGLAQFGFVEGRNVSFEYRFADSRLDRLPALADELVRRRVAVIFSGTNLAAALAAKAATNSIPIVFFTGADPVSSGLVASLAKPGGNITGVTILTSELFGKRLQLLHELVPSAKMFGYLVNRANPAFSENALKNDTAAAEALGVQLSILHASTAVDVDHAFAAFHEKNVEAMVLAPDTSYQVLTEQIIALAGRYRIPASFPRREYANVGGLMSYGADFVDLFHRCASYVARVLKGEAAKNLPVQQPTGFKLVLNKKAAAQIGIEIPPGLLTRADEVIE
jgi:putative ABC transport system substrate-binding protein